MRHLTIRARLLLASAVAVVGAVLLSALTLWGAQRGGHALESMLEGSVKPLVALQRIDGALSVVRARASGLLLDQYAAPGNLSHLRDVRKHIEAAWSVQSTQLPTGEEQVAMFKALREGWPKLTGLLDDLDKAYASGDRARVEELLDAGWPVAHKHFIKHLQALIPLQEASAHATYELAIKDNRQASIMALVLAGAMVVAVLGIMMLTMRTVVSGLREAVDTSKAIANGDLSDRKASQRHDELGELLSSLADMRSSLAVLVGDIRQTADSIQVASTEVASGNADRRAQRP